MDHPKKHPLCLVKLDTKGIIGREFDFLHFGGESLS